jgi:large subunit ribosomal protein L9
MKTNTVKVLLNESIRHVGRVGDVVEVKPGYARNYLLPKGLAVEPTKANLKKVEARKIEVERLEKEKRARHEQLIGKLAGVELTLERRANEAGHLFGSVSATDIAKALQAHAPEYAEIEPEDINLQGRLDHIDKYTVEVRFADDLAQEIKVYVAPDADSKELIDAAQKAKANAQAEAQARAAAEKAKAEAEAKGEAPKAAAPAAEEAKGGKKKSK